MLASFADSRPNATRPPTRSSLSNQPVPSCCIYHSRVLSSSKSAPMSRRLTAATLLLLFCRYQAAGAENAESVLRWASSGGGWRAMSNNVGFANLFSQAGLINQTSSKFTAISAASGGSFFTLQFFYSSKFFEKVLGDQDSAYRLTVDWMQAYEDWLETRIARGSLLCKLISLIGFIQALDEVSSLCTLFNDFEGDFAQFFTEMLRAATTGYGDPGLVDRIMNDQNRISALAQTELHTSICLAPNSRFFEPSKRLFGINLLSETDEISYLGPRDERDSVFAVPLQVQHVVKANHSAFRFAVEESSLPLQSLLAKAPSTFSLEDYEGFHLYDGTPYGGDVYASAKPISVLGRSLLSPFFGNETPTISQIFGSTTALFGTISGAIPSVMAQMLSRDHDDSEGFFQKFFQSLSISVLGNLYYNLAMFQDVAVCTQWPKKPCGSNDGRLIDGGIAGDGAGFVQNIAEYQRDGDLNKTLKIIYTYNNLLEEADNRFLGYFRTTFNQNVGPGDFVWVPGILAGTDQVRQTPWRSMQVFSDFLDDDLTDSARRTVTNRNFTYAVYNATTIDNAAYGVKAGQKVQILELRVNGNIPTVLISTNAVRSQTIPLAEAAVGIMSSAELLDVVKTFVGM